MYHLYIKGVAEPDYCAAAYRIVQPDGSVQQSRRESQQAMQYERTRASFCMELYAAFAAVSHVPDGVEVVFHSNNKTVVSWLTRMTEHTEPPYAEYWSRLCRRIVEHPLASIRAEWHKSGTCPPLDELRKFAFR